MKKKITALIIAAIAVYLLASMSYAATVTSATRTVAEFVDPDTEFDVTVTVEAVDEPITYIVYEIIAQNLTLVSANPAYWDFNEDSRKITWIIRDDGKTITYTLRSSVPGEYVFNGNVVGNNTLSIEGDISVKVRDNCTENWTCGDWSECVDGERTQECHDNNNCLFPVSIPPMIEECTVEVPLPEQEVPPTPPPANTGSSSSGGGGRVIIIPKIITPANDTTDDDAENQTVNNTEDDESSDNVTLPDDVKENKTDSEKITGLATSGDVNRSSGQESTATQTTDDGTKSEDKPADNNKMPFLTKALILIMTAAIIIFIYKKAK